MLPVKVMGFCLYLIDSEQVNVVKLDAKRRLRLDRMDKIFHELEVSWFTDSKMVPTLTCKAYR